MLLTYILIVVQNDCCKCEDTVNYGDTILTADVKIKHKKSIYIFTIVTKNNSNFKSVKKCVLVSSKNSGTTSVVLLFYSKLNVGML